MPAAVGPFTNTFVIINIVNLPLPFTATLPFLYKCTKTDLCKVESLLSCVVGCGGVGWGDAVQILHSLHFAALMRGHVN